MAREGLPRRGSAAFITRPLHSAPLCASRDAAIFSDPHPQTPCDKPRRECAEPTFTTAGTSRASLLNPVSNGYQHRASNVIRPAPLPHHCAGSPCARALALHRGAPARGSTGQHRPGRFSPEPPRAHDSLLVRVPGRCREMRTAPAALCGGGREAREQRVLRDSRIPSRYLGLRWVGQRKQS